MKRLHGLYVITDNRQDEQFIQRVSAALEGGARVVQLRDKSANRAWRLHSALALNTLCRERGALFIVNDDVELAALSKAHGVHIGQDDGSLAAAREHLGTDAIIGVSCYNRLDLALQAQAEGADYVAFGSVYPSPTKPDAAHASLDLLREARQQIQIPIAAIGGITPDNAPPLLAAGTDMLAVINGVFGADDVSAAAQRYAEVFAVQSLKD